MGDASTSAESMDHKIITLEDGWNKQIKTLALDPLEVFVFISSLITVKFRPNILN